MDDVYASPEFESLHTLQRRLGPCRRPEARPYEDVLKSLTSLRAAPTRRRFRLPARRERRTAA